MSGELYRVVVVEDSPTVQIYLRQILTEAGFLVSGTASTVKQAEKLVRQYQPHLMLCDIRLPDGSGIDLTRHIMSTHPLPVVLMTAYDPTNPDLVFQALDAGALDVLPKPPARSDPAFKNYADHFARTLRSLAGIPMVRRSALLKGGREIQSAKPVRPVAMPVDTETPVIAIGASTGGPTLVIDLLESLGNSGFQFAVVAQHMVPDFIDSFQKWLQSRITAKIRMATEGELPQPRFVYLIPPHHHLRMQPDRSWHLMPSSTVDSAHVPSITTLFESLAASLPRQVVAILLTGMGKDGSQGLKALKDAGAYTIVQDPRTAIISSMPQNAIDLDAASVVMAPDEIAAWLRESGWRNIQKK